MRTLTVGLVGPSAAGKSALADALSKLLPSTIALAVVSADAHYRPLHHCPICTHEIRWHSGSMPDAFRERARQLGRTFPAQPHWCRSLGKTCRWGVPLDGVSQVRLDEWRESQCLRFGQDHFSWRRTDG